MGVWTETPNALHIERNAMVTPHVGVWIETLSGIAHTDTNVSLPMWECGLKLIERI